jgi:endonuclease I
VRISVSLGDVVSPKATAAAPAPPTTPVGGPSEDAALQEALEELASARTRVYYDASSDEQAADEYYAGIRANVSAKTMFENLSRLVRTTHKTRIAYNPARHVYPWVDLHQDLRIRSIYSGQDFDPQTLIREDFRIDQERTARLRELLLAESTLSPGKMEEELDLLEAALPYNCEHVVPQSWFNRREPMRGDLHHLFACETRCNSFRGNIPYYDFPDFEEAVMDLCGKRGEDKFEPLRGKGTVARAVLYFLLRYPGQVGDVGREMQKDRLPTILDWHKQNPPEEYEKHRNMAVYEKQGNRNPLIDKPEWADRIDFSLGFD